jgi:predicted acylesterase/phospholipase RssA/CRP-like cAMP-binding protein
LFVAFVGRRWRKIATAVPARFLRGRFGSQIAANQHGLLETSESSSDRPELLHLIQSSELFGSLPAAIVAELLDAFETFHANGGTYLVRAGDPVDSLYGVLHGALRLIPHRAGGMQRPIREYYRGELLGVMGMFAERPALLDVVVMRDSELVRLSRARFLELVQKHPELLHAFARFMSEHVYDLLVTIAGQHKLPSQPRGGNLAVITTSDRPALRETARALVDLVVAEPASVRVDAALVDAALCPGAATGAGHSGRVSEWLNELERGKNVTVYESGTHEPAWMARSIRQSDRLLVVASAGDDARVEEVTEALSAPAGVVARRIELLLVHPRTTALPSGTSALSRLGGVSRIHHVRAGLRGDLKRVARHLLGRPIGVAFSGGGARGLAHLGVLAALVEAGIPIDYVCGTSMGSLFAAATAMDWSIARMREDVARSFARRFALYDLTVPISSLLAGKKLERMLHSLFEEADIEDLWLPFFCVSTDLSRATLVVHDRGKVWQCLRASASIPGMFPPLAMAGRSLVDGGLMDNLPIDLLAERCPGTIIAVDVFPYGEAAYALPEGRRAPILRAISARLKAAATGLPLLDILVRSTLVGSRFRQQTAAEHLKRVLYLEPPVNSFAVLGWRSHSALFEAGYSYAKERLRTPEFVGLAAA